MKNTKIDIESITNVVMVGALFVALAAGVKGQAVPPACVADPNADDPVKEWNCRAITLALTVPAPTRQVRHMAVVELAVSNAVNGMTHRYETYGPYATAPTTGSVDGAAIGAAYKALYGLFTTAAQRAALDAAFDASLSARGISAADPGVIFGLAAGANMVALRTSDGSGAAANCPYTDIPDPQPGQWRRINGAPAATPCWGMVTPFSLRSSDQFPLEGPPSLTDDRYTIDFLEVKAVGGRNAGTERQAWQTAIANFWDGSPAGIWNQVIRQAADAQNLDVSAKARAFALIYMASTDASIACFQAKYEFLFWRPETAVNLAETDGNAETQPLPGGEYWAPYLDSHPHPEYPSGHSSVSGGLGSASQLVFGNEPGVEMSSTITRTIPGTNPPVTVTVTRNWQAFSEGLTEVVDARVYSGLHYRFSDEAGARLGSQVARFAFTHVLRQCNKGNKCR